MNYSQNQEQEAILNYFGDFIGSFLDIGSNDGETFSNTRALALKGWSGVCVEPSPKAFERLEKLYSQKPKKIFCYPFAMGSHNGKATLKESGPLCSAADIGLVSTFHQHEQDRFKAVKYEPIEVKVFRWKTFYNRLKIKTFDFVSIDTEGEDLTILSQMDVKDVRAVCLEWNGKTELKTEFDRYLSGFKVIYTSGENLLYAR